jgi:hypothetical protein
MVLLLISSWVMVIPSPGWSYPITTTDNYLIQNFHEKTVAVTGMSNVHQIWDEFNQDDRIGYKCYMPDGTLIFPETMISNSVVSFNPTSTVVGTDNVAVFWREGSPAWYCVRNSDGTLAVPTSLYVPDPWTYRCYIWADSDSLGRIHSVFETSGGIVYNIFEPGAGEVRRDTIPDSMDAANILVDGSRVHIVFLRDFWDPYYIQYDLEGNVVIPPVVVNDLDWVSTFWTMAVDANGDLYCLFVFPNPYFYISLSKIEATTGDIIIQDKLIWDPDQGSNFQHILATPSGNQFYLIWLEDDSGGWPRLIMFSVIDTNGDFIEQPYAAYDYTDEWPEQLNLLSATTNPEGDVFAIWDEYFEEEEGFYIVMGWFDHEWLGIEEESTPVDPASITMSLSSNPFTDFLSIEVTGSPQVQELVIYDITGRQVRTLGSSNEMTFLWDGSDCEGNQLPSGAYIIRADTPEARATIKVVKLD